MESLTIYREDVRNALLAESTNAARTMLRNGDVGEFESVVIDEQADLSLNGVWREANAKLTEKMHPFLESSSVTDSEAVYVFATGPNPMVSDNIKMYIVDFMMQDWLASASPDHRKRYIDRADFEMDDLLRKLYKKSVPSNSPEPIDPDPDHECDCDIEEITNAEIDSIIN